MHSLHAVTTILVVIVALIPSARIATFLVLLEPGHASGALLLSLMSACAARPVD
ncbi:MAG: hypothetical protein ABR599_12930 [Gemmatimonadota bacterium]